MRRILPLLLVLAACDEREPPSDDGTDRHNFIYDADGRQLYVVNLEPSADVAAMLGQYGTKSECTVSAGFSAFLDRRQAEALRQDRRVLELEADERVELSAGPVWWPALEGEQEVSWGTRAVNAGGGGPPGGGNARIYVVDTGVELHPDLNVVQRINALKPGSTGAAAIPACYPHATHVAGIIGARNNTIGSRGVAPGAPIISVSVMDSRFVSTAGCACDTTETCGMGAGNLARSKTAWRCALDWVQRDIQASGVVGVINASSNSADFASGELFDRITAVTTPTATYKGALFVESAGNGFTDACGVTYNGPGPSLVVGALDDHGQPVRPYNEVKGFRNYALAGSEPGSNTGACVDLWAPGDGIFSTWRNQSYADLSGTSMAAPHVSALAYLMAPAGVRADALAALIPTKNLGNVTLASRDSVPANPLAALRGELRLGKATNGTFDEASAPSFTHAAYRDTFADADNVTPAHVGLQSAGSGTCTVERRRGGETPIPVFAATSDQTVAANGWDVGVWTLSSPQCPAAQGQMSIFPELRLRWLRNGVEQPAGIGNQPLQLQPGDVIGYRAQNAGSCKVTLSRNDGFGTMAVYALTDQPAYQPSVAMPTDPSYGYDLKLECTGPAPGLIAPQLLYFVLPQPPPPPPVDAGVVDASFPIDAPPPPPIDAPPPPPIDAPASCGVCTPGDTRACHGCGGTPVSCMGEQECTPSCQWGPCSGYVCAPSHCE